MTEEKLVENETSYVCSAGPFGGSKIAVSSDCPVDKETGEQRVDLEYIDDTGSKYMCQYNVRVHDPNSGEKALIFIGQTPTE